LKEKFIENYLTWLKANVFINEIEKEKKWVINSPFLDRHNDYIEIYIIKNSEDNFILTDDGFVYDDLLASGCEPTNSPKRKELFKLNLIGFGVNFNDKTHEIFLETNMAEIGKHKHKLAQAMLAIGDMFMLASHNVSSIFKEDLRINQWNKWGVLNEKKKIVARFRIKSSAEIFIKEHKREFFGEIYTLKNLELEDNEIHNHQSDEKLFYSTILFFTIITLVIFMLPL